MNECEWLFKMPWYCFVWITKKLIFFLRLYKVVNFIIILVHHEFLEMKFVSFDLKYLHTLDSIYLIRHL